MSQTALAARIQGLFNICVTPFDEAGQLDDQALSENLERVLALDYDGILIGGTYGEFSAQDASERARLFEAAMSVVGNRAPVLLCSAASDARDARYLTELAGKLGGLPMLTPPYASEITTPHIIEFFRELAPLSATGVMIYNAPGVGATLSPQTIETLAEIDGVVALKQGDLNPNVVDVLVSRLSGELKIIAASDMAMIAPLAAGVDGLSSTNSCALPEVIKAIFDAIRQGDLTRAQAMHRAWYPFRELCRQFGQPQTTKALMQIRGWRCGGVRAPLRNLSASEYAEVERVFTALQKNEALAPLF